jgi:four helix bundle protein
MIVKRKFMEWNLFYRLLDFGTAVINLSNKLGDGIETKAIRSQLSRSATSVGANYQEALSASSKADFINKFHISLKELMETIYWLHLIKSTSPNDPTIQKSLIPLLRESEELRKILNSSIITAKENLAKSLREKRK